MSEALETTVIGDLLDGLGKLSRRVLTLSWRAHDGSTQDHRIEDAFVIGSADEADLTLPDPTVSRLHAHVDIRTDGAWVRDAGSKNGTWINGVRVESARLEHGVVLRVGSTDLFAAYDAEPTAVKLWPVASFGPMVGSSAAMRQLFVKLDLAARSDGTVVLTGETGTGKELAAMAIHGASPRASAPFSTIDCGAIAPSMLDAELFGWGEDGLAGARGARAGAIEAADGGTVLLDEVGELPIELQPKLLRVIESRTLRRLGENEPRRVDVRFLAATHRDLREMVNDGTFREDLYFRLAVLPIHVPPLRERLDDIPLLIERFAPEEMRDRIGPEVLGQLAARPWPGNVRELRNVVERALAFGDAVPIRELLGTAEADPADFPSVPLDEPFHEVRARWLDHLEREYVSGLLKKHQGNMAQVARAAGLNRSYLYRLVKKHGL